MLNKVIDVVPDSQHFVRVAGVQFSPRTEEQVDVEHGDAHGEDEEHENGVPEHPLILRTAAVDTEVWQRQQQHKRQRLQMLKQYRKGSSNRSQAQALVSPMKKYQQM
jgi:hypothetical protein